MPRAYRRRYRRRPARPGRQPRSVQIAHLAAPRAEEGVREQGQDARSLTDAGLGVEILPVRI